MRTIAYYITQWLQLSDGFVYSQVRQSRDNGVVISRDGWMNLGAYPYKPRYSLHRKPVPGRLKTAALPAQLVPLLALTRAELVHVHFGYAADDVLGATGRRRPYVLTLYGHDVTGLLTTAPRHYERVVERVDAVIVLSAFLRDAAIRAGFRARDISIIPIGLDTSYFTPSPLPDGQPIVAYVGRLVEKKGLDVLLQAWPRIRDAVPAATLRVLGEGGLEHLLTQTDSSVIHIRPDAEAPRAQVRDAIRRATVVVTPSRTAASGDTESLLLVNLEAGASGRPVVSTYHGGVPEYVADGKSGLLVPENDADALADAVIRVLQDRMLAERLAATAVSHVAQWDVRKTTARVDDLHEEVLARRARH